MTSNPFQPELPHLLALLRDTPAGALYTLADKRHLVAGAIDCMRSPISGVKWGPARTTLTIAVQPRNRLTFSAAADRLTTACSCRTWTAGRQCPHVVAVWAILKRVVSPGALSQLRFDELHLREVTRLLGIGEEKAPPRPRAVPPRGDSSAVPARPQRDGGTQKARTFRLVLERQGDRLWGSLRKGNLPMLHWSLLPADLRKFQQSHCFFKPTGEYFREFTSLSGAYPIVFRHSDGREVELSYRHDAPLPASVTFLLDRGDVTISRGFAEGEALSGERLVEGECLFDPAATTIRPVTHLKTWEFWQAALDQVLATAGPAGEEVRRVPEGVTVSAPLFNRAALRIGLDRLAEHAAGCRFLAGPCQADPALLAASYSLEILDPLESATIRLAPLGEAGGSTFPLAAELFRLFDPARRARLSQPLKAKKRIAAIIDGCFSVLEATTTAGRAAALRAALATPEFIRRTVKNEAKGMITAFMAGCDARLAVIQAGGDGWRFTSDDRHSQARLVQTLYRLFGLDPFASGELPGTMALPASELLPRLGELAAALGAAGFGLRYRGEPLAVGAWDFVVAASRHAIDWFELRPEIRCNGALLADEEIRLVLAQGMIRQGDACYLLGDEQRRILELLLGGTAGKGKKPRKGEPLRIPRLQILDWLELRGAGVALRLPPEDERLLASLTSLERVPVRPLPAGLKASLRHYQEDGYQWLAFLYEHRFGACLADDMGLGKTVQTIAMLAGIAEGQIVSAAPGGTPHLIVVPPSLLFNWESECARFCPTLRLASYTGQRRTPEFAGADIVLTSYGILQRDIATLEKLPFDVVVFDEAQQVKNLQAATTAAARRINGRFKLALTGTPVENHLGEYYAIMDLSLPGLLGPYEEFRRRIDIRGFGGIDTLIRRTRPFVLRRSKQMIVDELPPRIETDLYLELTPRQRALYQKTVEEVRGAVDQAFRARASGQARLIALTAILRLRQICLSPSLITPGGKGDSPKLECLADQLLELREEGHSALVFSQFTSYLDLVEEGLKRHGIATIRLDGSTPVPRRKELVRRFQESGAPLAFLISLKAGGKGLNLTRASYVYHLDPWWNPAVENQASDRAHRIGQTAQVTVTRLLMRHTVEEKMMALKERKLRLYKALLDDAGGAGGVSLSREDFDFLLST